MNPGDTVYVLNDYRMYAGTLVKINKTTASVDYDLGRVCREPLAKVAGADELMCVVWEMWKGRNGRGGYRIERTRYPERHKPARCYHPSDRVWEREKPE